MSLSSLSHLLSTCSCVQTYPSLFQMWFERLQSLCFHVLRVQHCRCGVEGGCTGTQSLRKTKVSVLMGQVWSAWWWKDGYKSWLSREPMNAIMHILSQGWWDRLVCTSSVDHVLDQVLQSRSWLQCHMEVTWAITIGSRSWRGTQVGLDYAFNFFEFIIAPTWLQTILVNKSHSAHLGLLSRRIMPFKPQIPTFSAGSLHPHKNLYLCWSNLCLAASSESTLHLTLNLLSRVWQPKMSPEKLLGGKVTHNRGSLIDGRI